MNNPELKIACERLAILIKSGKAPVNYNKLWRDFAKKKPFKR